MRPVAQFAHLLPDTIRYQALSCQDSYNDPVYGTVRTYRARVVGEQKAVRAFSGAEVVSAQTVYVGAALVVQPTDRITLSTGAVNSTEDSAIHPPILGARRIPDQRGVHHSVIYLG